MGKYHLLTAAAHMPARCRGKYKRIAIVESLDGSTPATIRESKRARIIKTWEKLNVGRTDKCAFQVALTEAREECDRLNRLALENELM